MSLFSERAEPGVRNAADDGRRVVLYFIPSLTVLLAKSFLPLQELVQEDGPHAIVRPQRRKKTIAFGPEKQR